MTDKDIQELNGQHINVVTKWIKEQKYVIKSISLEPRDMEDDSRDTLESYLDFESPEEKERIEVIEEINTLKRKLGRIENDIANKKIPSPPKNVPEIAPLTTGTVNKVPEGFMDGWKFIISPSAVYCWRCKRRGTNMYEYNNGIGGVSHMCIGCKAVAEEKGLEPPIPK